MATITPERIADGTSGGSAYCTLWWAILDSNQRPQSYFVSRTSIKPPNIHNSSKTEVLLVVVTYDTPTRFHRQVLILDASKRYPPSQLAAHSLDEFIDLQQASRLSGIVPATLRRQAESGKLWRIRLGGQWLTTRDQLQHYLDSRSKKGKLASQR